MTVTPSCPVLVIHEDDAYRKSLIRTLDERHFTVTFSTDGAAAVGLLRDRPDAFQVILIQVDLASERGLSSLAYLRDHRESVSCAVIIIGEPDPKLRTYAPWASETLMKPVDPDYVATRARGYCR